MSQEQPFRSSHAIVGILSASELSLGSYLHLLRIPLTGQLMSLNQCFWLNVAKCWSPADSALSISLQVAGIKMISPFGKRITPMVAIATQGLLFEMGTRLFGSGLLGRFIGSALLVLWSVAQPLLLYGLLLGGSMPAVISFLIDKGGVNLYLALLVVVSIKIIAAVIVSLAAAWLSSSMIERYGRWIYSLESRLTPRRSLAAGWNIKSLLPLSACLLLLALYTYSTTDSLEFFLRSMAFYLCWMVGALYLLHHLEQPLLRLAKYAYRK